VEIIINAASLRKGGGIQVALSLIAECVKFTDHEFHVFVSPALREQIQPSHGEGIIRFYDIPHYPSSPRYRMKMVRLFSVLETRIQPDCVFTVFGPSYWRPGAPHVMGFALVWTINPDALAYNQLPWRKRQLRRLKNRILLNQIRKDGDVFVVETEDVKKRLHQYGNIAPEKIFVVSNTASHFFFREYETEFELPEKNNFSFRLVTVSANYPHKNLTIIKKVLPYLRLMDPETSYGFYLTLEDHEFSSLFESGAEGIVNIGQVPVHQVPGVYHQCHALFLPTLLECFTASYPEAMAVGRPILTSDLDFARSICGDAATYINPLDPEDIAEKIIALTHNPDLQKQMVKNGQKQLESFNSPAERAGTYVEICNKISTVNEANYPGFKKG